MTVIAVEDWDRAQRVSHDHIVVLEATWADYQRMLEMRGDKSAPRISYSEGLLEIMSPSQPHESIKSLIGRLVEVYCLEAGIEFKTVGAWTLERKELERGVEPDESYIFGGKRNAPVPDLVIEVVWTSRGINKLNIYRALGVREVWVWERGRISIFELDGADYVATAVSANLPGIDIVQLATFLDRETTSEAMRAYRDALRAR